MEGVGLDAHHVLKYFQWYKQHRLQMQITELYKIIKRSTLNEPGNIFPWQYLSRFHFCNDAKVVELIPMNFTPQDAMPLL